MDLADVSVIIPAYNEGPEIGPLVAGIRSLHPDYELIVVDDGSTDDTAEAARAAGARVVRHPYNIGNGAAVKSGIRHACGEVLVFLDGDGQHDPADIERLVACFPEYDMVVGARSNRGQASMARLLANRFYNWLASYAAKFRVVDLTSGFRAIKAPVARGFIYLLPNTYSYPTTLTLSVLRSGRSLKYLSIRTRRRRTGKSKIHLLHDGVRFFMIIVKICTLYSPFRIFLPVSLFSFMAGLAHYLYTLIFWGRFTNMSLLLLTTAVIIFMMGLVSEQVSQMRYQDSEESNVL